MQKCWCCGRKEEHAIQLPGCCRKRPIWIGVECGCALAFDAEWEFAVEDSGYDLDKMTPGKPWDEIKRELKIGR